MSGSKNKTFRRFEMLYLPREEGQGLVEYALILVLIAIVVIVILTTLGGVINDVFGDVVAGLGG